MKIPKILMLLTLLALTVSACAQEESQGTPEEKLFHGFPYNLNTG